MDTVDAEKKARYARLDPKILRPISHRTVALQEAVTLIRARNLIVRLRTAAVNSVRGLAKPRGYSHSTNRVAWHYSAEEFVSWKGETDPRWENTEEGMP